VTADANYDAEDFLKFIIKELKAQAIIPHNPRNAQPKGHQLKRDKVICEAGLPMYRKGKRDLNELVFYIVNIHVRLSMIEKFDTSTLYIHYFIRSFSMEKVVT